MWPQTKLSNQHIYKCENQVSSVNTPRPFFEQDAYTKSDNAPMQK